MAEDCTVTEVWFLRLANSHASSCVSRAYCPYQPLRARGALPTAPCSMPYAIPPPAFAAPTIAGCWHSWQRDGARVKALNVVTASPWCSAPGSNGAPRFPIMGIIKANPTTIV